MKKPLLALAGSLLSLTAWAQTPASPTPVHRVSAHRAAPAPAAKEQAYYCASGNTVKYHSSSTCRGLNRCSATVKPLALSDAQAQMDACKICH